MVRTAGREGSGGGVGGDGCSAQVVRAGGGWWVVGGMHTAQAAQVGCCAPGHSGQAAALRAGRGAIAPDRIRTRCMSGGGGSMDLHGPRNIFSADCPALPCPALP